MLPIGGKNKIISKYTMGRINPGLYFLKIINNSWAIQPMIITYLITRCHLDNPVKLDESHYSVFIKYHLITHAILLE
jgi:hypothetical protein